MFVTIINDCRDANAFGRQKVRVASLFGDSNLSEVVSVAAANDLEAAGNLVDVLDASDGKKGVILVNVAPRNGEAHQFSNGTPFGFFFHRETVVISSIAGRTLSLVQKLGLAKDVQVIDLEATVKRHCSQELANHIVNTQFRSYEFLPRVARWLVQGDAVNSVTQELVAVPSNGFIWLRDCFGNLKTTKLPEEIGFADGEEIRTINCRKIRCYGRGLRSVPDRQLGLVVGSSGFGASRFVEIVINGGNAAAELGLDLGSEVFN